MNAVTGSLNLKSGEELTPFERAQLNIAMFMVGMQSSSAYEELASRIGTIDAIMKLPIMHVSSSSETVKQAKESYEREMKEIELALKLISTVPGIPEA